MYKEDTGVNIIDMSMFSRQDVGGANIKSRKRFRYV